jgi:hypothetical protein
MKRSFILIFIIASFRLITSAQEVITGLLENPVIRAVYEQKAAEGIVRNLSDEEMPVTLPFFDDFHQSWIYPDENRWIDEEAYVNTNYGFLSANIGVATLDAINRKGNLHANASQFPFLADSLTSRLIRLDSLFVPSPKKISRADSIYFSFYYQPQGRASFAPEGFDSLILQFGHFTGDSIFSYSYDSIWVPLSLYIQPGDTIFPGDTVFSPSGDCDDGLFVVSTDYYFYDEEILLPCDSVFEPEFKWQRIWSSAGMTLEDFHAQYGTYSRQVMIPILDSSLFYRRDFRFRFINYASLASDNNPSWRSNCDHWNIDFVYLNAGRSYKDTVYRDVTFVERAPSMLKRYESMPFNQYFNNPGNEMKDNLDMVITNLDSTIFNSTYYYVVYQVDGPFEYLYPGGNCNLFPFNINGHQNCVSCAAHACPPVNFNFPLSTADSAEFEIRHFIIGDITPTDTVGDTISFRQKFHNYYAYDDGTPEQGYGLTPAGSKLAYRFNLNVKDTLRAIQMHFNHTQNDANAKFFNLMVWRDNNGKPGDVIYSQLNEKVEYPSGLLGFHTYFLDEPILVNGTFYIGWEQQTSDNLNLGYDTYNNAQQNIYYNSTGEWFQSIYQGALMMRPMLGKPFDFSSVDELQETAGSITPYPNPLTGNLIRFRCTGIYEDQALTGKYSISIMNLPGEEIFTGAFTHQVDPGRLSPGLYIIAVKDESGQIISVSKLIKNN